MKNPTPTKAAPLYLVMSRINAKKEISTRIFPLTRAVLKGKSWFYPAGSGTKEVPVKSLKQIDVSEMKYKNIVKAYCLKSCLHSVMNTLESKCGSMFVIPVAKRNKKSYAEISTEPKNVPAIKSIPKEIKSNIELLVPTKIFSQRDMEDINAVNDILSGKKNSFAVIYKRYYPILHRKYVMSLKYNKDLADDLVEDLFIKVYEKIDKYKPEYTFNAWITRLASNFLIDYTRKAKLQTVSMSNTVISNSHPNGDAMEYEFVDVNALSGEQVLMDSEKKNIINKALMNLDKRSRSVLSLLFVQGKTYQEISDELDMPVNNVKVTIHRAKQKLKEVFTSDASAMAVLAG